MLFGILIYDGVEAIDLATFGRAVDGAPRLDFLIVTGGPLPVDYDFMCFRGRCARGV